MNKKVCVIGAGRWGKNHIKTLHKLGVLGCVVDVTQEILSEVNELYPEVETLTRLSEAIEKNYDGYTVATPAETHYKVAAELIEHGKHVLVEKPLALNSKEASHLIKLADENKVNLMVGHLLLFHPAIWKIKEIMDAGKIGKLQYIYSNRLNLGTVRKEENILWSFAPHDISIFRYLIGSRPLEIVSRGGAFTQPHLHDTTMTVLSYPDNIIGHIFVSWLHPFKEHRIVLIGTKGMLSFEDSGPEKKIMFYEKGIDWVKGEPVKREGPTEKIEYRGESPLTNEMKYFVEHLDGSPLTIADGVEALAVLKILERASASLFAEGGTLSGEEAAQTESPDYYIHPSSCIDEDVIIGNGTKIWHFSHVQQGAVIGDYCTIGQNVNLGPNIRIGNNVKIQNNVSVYEGIELQDNVFCGPSMVFTNVTNPRAKYPRRSPRSFERTVVREGASLGANCTIVCGNEVGRHAFVGAGAVVTQDVPDYALMVGIPARRTGWMCECGTKLDENKDNLICGKCGKTYTFTSNEASSIVESGA